MKQLWKNIHDNLANDGNNASEIFKNKDGDVCVFHKSPHPTMYRLRVFNAKTRLVRLDELLHCILVRRLLINIIS